MTDIETVAEAANERFTALQRSVPKDEFSMAVLIDHILCALSLAAMNADSKEEAELIGSACVALATITTRLDADSAVIKATLRALLEIRTDAETAINNKPDVKEVLKGVM